jgi:Leucine Rich repeat
MHLARGCPNLRTAHLDLACPLTVQSTMWLALYCPKLRHVLMPEGCLSDESITALARGCRRLQSIEHKNINRNKDISDIGITELAMHCNELQRISFFLCELISDEGVSHLAQNCPQLNDIVLGGTNITDVGVIALARNCSHIRRLDVTNCKKCTSLGITEIAKCCRNLTHLGVSGCVVNDAAMEEIAANCPAIRTIGCRNCPGLGDFRGSFNKSHCLEAIDICTIC